MYASLLTIPFQAQILVPSRKAPAGPSSQCKNISELKRNLAGRSRTTTAPSNTQHRPTFRASSQAAAIAGGISPPLERTNSSSSAIFAKV